MPVLIMARCFRHNSTQLYLRAMRRKKWLLIGVVLSLIVSLFLPWVVIESRNIVISGMQAAGTTYGKPGLLTLVLGSITLIFALVQRIWAHRICIFSSALNAGWALRNFFILSVCQGGECPQRQPGFYLYFISSILLLIVVLIQEQPLKESMVE